MDQPTEAGSSLHRRHPCLYLKQGLHITISLSLPSNHVHTKLYIKPFGPVQTLQITSLYSQLDLVFIREESKINILCQMHYSFRGSFHILYTIFIDCSKIRNELRSCCGNRQLTFFSTHRYVKLKNRYVSLLHLLFTDTKDTQ